MSAAEFAGRSVLICGAGVAGRSAARALLALGTHVQLCDDNAAAELVSDELPAGVEFRGKLVSVGDSVDFVVASPGLAPSHPVLRSAAAAGIEVLGELELAWRLRGPGAADWLMISGTNGKTTTTRMLTAMLMASGRRALAVGNIGVSVVDAVRAGTSYQVLAVEASSFQLHFCHTVHPRAGALLNVAPDHLDWHGSLSAYTDAKAKVLDAEVAVGNFDDPTVARLLQAAPAERRCGFSLLHWQPGRYGVRAGQLVDPDGAVILPIDDVRPAGMHNVANALAAAALAASVGVSGADIATGLRSFVADPHRNSLVAEFAGVRYVDDSKATNPHAAAASMAVYESFVWIAGGQLKGAPVTDLVAEFASRLRGVVLLGADQDVIADALARHAPNVPVITVSSHDDETMTEVVTAATSLAHAGDVVLLAPAAASLDMYASYAARGTAFADAVHVLARRGPDSVS